MLNPKAREIIALIKRGANVPQLVLERPIHNVQLKESTVAFVKGITNPPEVTPRGIAHVKTVKNLFAAASDIVGKIQKRAMQQALTEEEIQGFIVPTVGAKLRTEDGLSDADLRVLEQEITSGNPAIAPGQASKLFAESYAVISANPGRRITDESDAFGIPSAPGGYLDRRRDNKPSSKLPRQLGGQN